MKRTTTPRQQGAVAALGLMLSIAAGPAWAESRVDQGVDEASSDQGSDGGLVDASLDDAAASGPNLPPPIAVTATWPTGAGAILPADGVIHLAFEGDVEGPGLPRGLRVVIEDLAVPAAPVVVAGGMVGDMSFPGGRVFWLPEVPFAAGGRYRLLATVDGAFEPDRADEVLADVPFTVSAENAPAVAPAPEPTWCNDTVQTRECINPDGGSCGEIRYYAPELRPRATLLPPDREALAKVGLLYEWQDPGVGTFQIWGAETEITTRPTAEDAEACLSTRVRRIVGLEFEDTRHCAPSGLALCADARPLDSADWQPYDRTDSESDGCQASPGAGGVPLVAGLFALLLGLGRRRRT